MVFFSFFVGKLSSESFSNSITHSLQNHHLRLVIPAITAMYLRAKELNFGFLEISQFQRSTSQKLQTSHKFKGSVYE
uniref:Uncharacterized protein n=1 Tax=Noccaea caerulescens TaxID=107243 RepID=A0A1J3CIU2_NOCCA